MKSISILGCGWLGLPLAKSLVAKGFSVKGSTTSATKITVLEEHGIEAFRLELKEAEIKGEVGSFLEHSEILIIDIPPKLRGNASENFVAKIQVLIPFIEKSAIAKVLFVSSISVYADVPLSSLKVTEETTPYPDTESGKQLLEAENILLNNKNFQTTVIRFGGLIGDDRHPVNFLAGKENLENLDAPVNLIHQKDCIGIIEAMLKQAQNGKMMENETFNAVAPFHPTRKEYYTKRAVEMNLSIPKFEEGKESIGKCIESGKIAEKLDYTFQESEL